MKEDMFNKIILTGLLFFSNAMIGTVLDRDTFEIYENKILKKHEQIALEVVSAIYLLSQQKYEDMIKSIDQAIFLSSEKINKGKIKNEFIAFLCALRAKGNYLLGNYSTAISDSDHALYHDKNNAMAYYWRGYAYIRLGNVQTGRVCVKTSASKGYIPAKEEVAAYSKIYEKVKIIED